MRFEYPRPFSPQIPAFFWPNCPCCDAGFKTVSKLDTSGNALWHGDHGANCVDVDGDASGNVATVGNRLASSPNYTIRYYDPDGDLLLSVDSGPYVPGLGSIPWKRSFSVTPTRIYQWTDASGADPVRVMAFDTADGSELWRYTNAIFGASPTSVRKALSLDRVMIGGASGLTPRMQMVDEDGASLDVRNSDMTTIDFDFMSSDTHIIGVTSGTTSRKMPVNPMSASSAWATLYYAINIDPATDDVFCGRTLISPSTSFRLVRVNQTLTEAWSVSLGTGGPLKSLSVGAAYVAVVPGNAGDTVVKLYDFNGNHQWTHDYGAAVTSCYQMPDDSATYICGVRVAI